MKQSCNNCAKSSGGRDCSVRHYLTCKDSLAVVRDFTVSRRSCKRSFWIAAPKNNESRPTVRAKRPVQQAKCKIIGTCAKCGLNTRKCICPKTSNVFVPKVCQ